jgi:D-3-phosphoglycerate dehydrogenase
VQGGVIAEEVRPGIPLAERLGRFFTALAGTVPAQLDVEVRGEITAHDVRVLELAVLKGMFVDVVEDPVSYVNAPVLAGDRGIGVRLTTDADAGDYRNLISVRGTMADGTQVSVSGTLSGPRHVEKLVEVDGFDIEVGLSDHMALFRYADRPGIVGTVGRILGEAQVNIAGMQVSRDERGGKALMALTVDSAIPHSTLEEIVRVIGAESGRSVDLEG